MYIYWRRGVLLPRRTEFYRVPRSRIVPEGRTVTIIKRRTLARTRVYPFYRRRQHRYLLNPFNAWNDQSRVDPTPHWIIACALIPYDRGGCLFFGTMEEAVNHFTDMGHPPPPTQIPTDFFLQVNNEPWNPRWFRLKYAFHNVCKPRSFLPAVAEDIMLASTSTPALGDTYNSLPSLLKLTLPPADHARRVG